MSAFQALVLREVDGGVSTAIENVPGDRLPPGDVTIAVEYSTLNYKDGLILNGQGRLVRQYPHVPGIDFVGAVEASDHPDWKPGDRAILTGWRVGETQWGGYAQKARVRGEWLVPLPEGLTPERAMAVGTAGFTAMLAVMALEEHGVTPDRGEVLVTGAAGGVGSIATAVLSKLGYSVAASTGRPQTSDYLRELGAATIVDRAELQTPSGKPLESERWAGCIDSVGGPTLATALARLRYRGAVAACGLAGGTRLDTTVIPFIIRGVSLLGIDSVMCPLERRRRAWSRIVRDLPPDKLDRMIQPASLVEVPALGKAILAGQVRGRVVIDVNR